MAQIVRMPSVMANATDAVLSEWLISPGDTIAAGDPLAEIETDKAVVEYAAEVDGTIGRLLVEPGARVVVGDPIAVVLAEGEDPSVIPLDTPSAPAATTADEPTPAPANMAESGPAPPPSQRTCRACSGRTKSDGQTLRNPNRPQNCSSAGSRPHAPRRNRSQRQNRSEGCGVLSRRPHSFVPELGCDLH